MVPPDEALRVPSEDARAESFLLLPGVQNMCLLLLELFLPGNTNNVVDSISPYKVEPGRHPGYRVPDHVDQVHLQVVLLPIRDPHVADVHRVLLHLLHRLHQLNLLVGISQIVLYIMMQVVDNREVVFRGKLFEKSQHRRGATLGDPGGDVDVF